MSNYDLILKNADCVSFDKNKNTMVRENTSIGVLNGKIAATEIFSHDTALETLDLMGLTVFPGIIDSQVHFREPGMTHKEDLESGTRSALLGGITSVFEMPNTAPPTTTQEAFQQKLDLAKNRAHCHFGFFIGGAADNIDQLPILEKHPNCSGVKVFLGSSFGNLLVDDDIIFDQILKNGQRRVIIHSEDEKRLKERKQLAIDAGHPRAHPIWRDEESAMISTKKSIHYARKNNRPIHVLHISSSEEMALLGESKDIATVEILPQFLVLSAPECYERLGTFAQQNPPIRDKRHLEKLWTAVQSGIVDVIGSDHAPHTIEEKGQPYPKSPSGVPGVQTLIPIMLNEVHKGNLGLEKLIQLITENPRRIFNAKNKGRIEIGYDADFTVVDLKRTETIEKKWLASRAGWSPFEGMKMTGWPVMTILRGQLAMREAQILRPHTGEAVEFSF
jgi:dihydroorotase